MDRTAPPRLKWFTDWPRTMSGFLWGVAVSIAANVASDDLGVHWVILLLVLAGGVALGCWLSPVHQQTTFVRWFCGLCLAGAAVAAGVSVLGPGAWAAPSAVLGLGFVATVLARSRLEAAIQVLIGAATVAVGLTVMVSGARAVAAAPLIAAAALIVGGYIVTMGVGHLAGTEGPAGRTPKNVRTGGLRHLVTAGGFVGTALMFIDRYPLGVIASAGLAAAYVGAGLILLREDIAAWWERVTTPPPGSEHPDG